MLVHTFLYADDLGTNLYVDSDCELIKKLDTTIKTIGAARTS